jgi:DNA repair photolyase
MYPFIDYTWNPIRGECPHKCGYCYVERIRKRFNIKPTPLRFIEFSLNEWGPENGNKVKSIFVGSAMDIFASAIPGEWIGEIVSYSKKRPWNSYLFQTKNPSRYFEFCDQLPIFSMLATTLESNREYPHIYNLAPPVTERVKAFKVLKQSKMITIEPIMDFDVPVFSEIILSCNPQWVTIGADTGNNHLPEPPPEKTGALIRALRSYKIDVYLKKNLKRVYREETGYLVSGGGY